MLEMNGLNANKAGALLVLLLLALLPGLLPIKLRKMIFNQTSFSEKSTRIALSASLCFGAGVLMATVFLHILNETREKIHSMMDREILKETDYPVSELILCLGFFLIYFLEEVAHIYIIRNHSEATPEDIVDECHLQRISSIRSIRGRCSESRNGSPKKNSLSNEVTKWTENNNGNGIDDTACSCSHNREILKETIAKDETSKIKIDTVECNNDNSSLQPFHDDSMELSVIRSILVILALSLHGTFEGLSLGLENNIKDVWLLCAALSAHKVFIAFSIGMELLEVEVERRLYIIHILIFSLASPLGGIIGTALRESVAFSNANGQIIIAVLQGISGGTILYVTFCEVLERERTKQWGRFVRLLALICGFALMAGLQAAGHDHEDDINLISIVEINATLPNYEVVDDIYEDDHMHHAHH